MWSLRPQENEKAILWHQKEIRIQRQICLQKVAFVKMSTYSFKKKEVATLGRRRRQMSDKRFYMSETRSTAFPLEVVPVSRPRNASVSMYVPRAADAPGATNPAKPVIRTLAAGYGEGKDVRKFSDVIGLKKNVNGGLIAKQTPNPLVFIQRQKVYEGNGPTNLSRFYRRQALVPRHSDGFKHRATRFDKVTR